MASETTEPAHPPPFLAGDDVTPGVHDEPLPVEDLDELAGLDEESPEEVFEESFEDDDLDDDGHEPV